MSSPIGPADLLKFHSGLKSSDIKNWKPVPASAVVQPTAQMKAEMAAGEERARQYKAAYDAQTAANAERYGPVSESNTMFMTNVATLPETEIQPRIKYVAGLIQSGEAEKYAFQSANGDQATTSIHQYLFWLQQRAQGLNDDGTYAPDMLK